MNWKIFFWILTILLVCVVVFSYYQTMQEEKEPEKTAPQFQGPVPQGYDEQHFRLTGELRVINETN